MTRTVLPRRPFLRRSLAIALLAVVACGGHPRPELPRQATATRGFAEPRYAAAIAVAESLAADLTTASPAISAAVAVGDSLVWTAAFGFADRDAGTRATPTSRFRIYSLSKGITAAAALRLREDGALDLDAQVSRWVPEFPARDGVTARRLLGHLGGIRHYRPGEAIATRHCARPVDALPVFAGDALESVPGSTYHYSSWGYVLLSAVLESAGGTTFDSLLHRAVFAPAGMMATGLPESLGLLPGEVTPYEPTRNGVRRARDVGNRCKFGAGALVATAADVARFGAALLGGRLLPPAAVEELLTPMTTAGGASTDYAMGFGVATDATGRRLAVHGGSAIGGRAAIVLLPASRVTVVILSNVEGDRLTSAALTMARAFHEASTTP